MIFFYLDITDSYLHLYFPHHVIQDQWIGWFPLLYLDWITNIQIEEGRFQKIFCLILSNLNPFKLR